MISAITRFLQEGIWKISLKDMPFLKAVSVRVPWQEEGYYQQ